MWFIRQRLIRRNPEHQFRPPNRLELNLPAAFGICRRNWTIGYETCDYNGQVGGPSFEQLWWFTWRLWTTNNW
jgi:hypothetical protein